VTLGRSRDSAATSTMGAPPVERPSGGACSGAAHAIGRSPVAAPPARDRERYTFLGEHGRGALGSVSRAHDLELGRDVAIKELISRDAASEARFLREALITARLEHPGIVAVHEAGRWPDGTPFYAMKLVSGRPLRELIAERATVDERLGLLHHVIAVADAIAYAHGRNIIHRDLKPANIIVGDFGETIVIDWGLAKDLAASDEPIAGGSQPRGAGSEELTSVGTVLGTPAYMAPEQGRGEHVDRRADVYAIGVMLWELCALTRTPPAQVRHRRRALRRTGIDGDLATIIGKALDPDPERRYPDAGALANDLKAFKSGARIGARRYSPPAMLAHWLRRHRTISYSVLAALVAVTTGGVVFVRDIAISRDRADRALRHAEVANGDRMLGHAELLLQTDPTGAVAALADYRGSDAVRLRRLRAEAEGRGVARAVLTPHGDTVWFAVGDQTGAVISLGEDRRIQLTRGATSTTLATDVSAAGSLAYEPAQRVLAYGTSPAGISVLDLRTMTAQRIAGFRPVQLAFAPDGSRIAALDRAGQLGVWQTGPELRPIQRATVSGATAFAFATPDQLIVLVRAALHRVALDGGDGEPGLGPAGTVAEVTALDAQPDAVAAGTRRGELVILSPSLVVSTTLSVCRKRIRSVRFLPHTDLLGYACDDPSAGLVRHDAARGHLAVVTTFATRGATELVPDRAGRYLALIDESHTAYLYDTVTRLVRRYAGNAGQPSQVSPPTPEFDHLLVGDVNGTVRVWDPPGHAARAVVQAPDAIFGLAFSPDSTTVFTGGLDGIVRRIAVGSGAVTELIGHTAMVVSTRTAPDGSSALSFGHDGTVRVWRGASPTPGRVFADHGSVVGDAEYIERGRRIVSVGDDGRLLAWPPDGREVAVWFKHGAPLTSVEALARNDHAVVKDARGSIWDVAPDGAVQQVREPDGATVTTLRASRDGSYLATGTDTGVVTVYDTASWRVISTTKATGGIRQIQFDPLGRDLIVASEPGRAQDGRVQIVPLGGQRALRWREVVSAVRDVAYAPDGETIGFVCADGGTWLYGVRTDTWVYARDHEVDTPSGRFSPDGQLFVSSDRRGLVVVRDVASTLRGAVNSSPPGSP
jgi:eukaryotic-like serine/threonine-protein kinase